MIAAFFTWLESLGWQAALLFMLALVIGGCIIILLIDWAIRASAQRRELRAIKKKNWQQRKERVARLIEAQREREAREADDAAFLRRLEIDVARDDLQKRREARQFHIPAAFRDFKGTQR